MERRKVSITSTSTDGPKGTIVSKYTFRDIIFTSTVSIFAISRCTLRVISTTVPVLTSSTIPSIFNFGRIRYGCAFCYDWYHHENRKKSPHFQKKNDDRFLPCIWIRTVCSKYFRENYSGYWNIDTPEWIYQNSLIVWLLLYVDGLIFHSPNILICKWKLFPYYPQTTRANNGLCH